MLRNGGDPLPLNNSKDDLLNKIDSIPRTMLTVERMCLMQNSNNIRATD